MSYSRNQYKFDNLITKAFEDKDIEKAVKDAGRGREFFRQLLVTTLEKKVDEIWNTGSSEIDQVDELEKTLKLKNDEATKLKPARPSVLGSRLSNLPWLRIILILLALLAVAYVVSGFFLGWTTIFTWIIAHLDLTGSLAVTGILLALDALITLLYYIRSRVLTRKYERLQADWSDNIRNKQFGIPELEKRIQESERSADQAILKKGILPELRLILNAQLVPSYKTYLKPISSQGLAEVFEPEYEILTEPRNKIDRLLNRMPGGSIGVAGPRGAGKTTLLSSFCDPNLPRLDGKIKGSPALRVMVSAPVEYDAREFILYIFLSICKRILHPEVNETIQPPRASIGEMRKHYLLKDPLIEDLLRTVGMKVMLASILIGLSLIVGSIYIASILIPTSTLPSPASRQAVATSTSTTPTSTSTTPTSTSATSTSTPATYITALEIKPGVLLSWGLFLAIFGSVGYFGLRIVLLRFYERELRRRNLLENFESELRRRNLSENFESELRRRELLLFYENEWRRRVSPFRRIILRLLGLERLSRLQLLYQMESQVESTQPDYSLTAKALRWENAIRFQQSYSSGWSGTLKLPVAVEGAVNETFTLAQNQLSLPEIIEGYRGFLKSLRKVYEIIIGIDELDKIESDEKAQRFLNEIKGLFGLEACFYIVSVSESAMISFERRGLPFRDAFDSSFDTIVFVDYLTLATARLLLQRRVIGLPVPFLCFCYCMSGGLARDLIRVCRDLFEHAQLTPNENDLPGLCSFLIKSDIQSKLRALLSMTTNNIASEPEVSQFFDNTRQLQSALATGSVSSLLRDYLNKFRNTNEGITQLRESKEDIITNQGTAQKTGTEDTITKRGKWDSLNTEFGIYLYYSLTLLELFEEVDQEKWKIIESSGHIDELAKARQFLITSPRAADSLISEFRKAYGLK